jgi:hypothetical protein
LARSQVRTSKQPHSSLGVVGPVGIGLGLLSGAILLFCFDPSAVRIYPPCPLHYLTGLYCPGCGSLRALHQLLHGHLACALALNPLLVLALPLLVFVRLRPSWRYRPWLGWTCLGLVVVYGVARNVPCWPFVLLAPN